MLMMIYGTRPTNGNIVMHTRHDGTNDMDANDERRFSVPVVEICINSFPILRLSSWYRAFQTTSTVIHACK